MNDDAKDRILDAYLQEILRGERPPDLTNRILTSLDSLRSGETALGDGSQADAWLPPPSHPHPIQSSANAPPLAPNPAPAPIAPPVQLPQRPLIVTSAASERVLNGRVNGRRRNTPGTPAGVKAGTSPGSRRTRWAAAAVSAAVLLVGGVLGVLAWQRSRPQDRLVHVPPRDGQDTRSSQPTKSDVEPGPEVVIGPEPGTELGPLAPQPDPIRPADAFVTPARPPRLSDAEVVAFINSQLRQAWAARGVSPTEPEPAEGWADRICRQVLGREPSADEISLLAGADRGGLVLQLLEANLPQFAEHWADILTKELLSSTAGDPRIQRAGLRRYLADTLAQGKSYDQLTRELITAVGSVDPEAADFNGAANFLVGGFDHNRQTATTKVARVFLGKQLDCVTCHDSKSPESQLAQRHFWQLNAFFWQLNLVEEDEQVQLVDRDFEGEGGNTPKEAEIYFKDPDQRVFAAYPEFEGARISPSGLLADVNRRTELARLVTQSRDFSRATVNRIWARLLGFGFCNPIDDLGPHNPPSHPELLDQLADQFAAHDFDLKRLVGWIAASEAFGLSGAGGSDADTPAMGSVPLFTRYYAREETAATADESLRLLVKRHSRSGFSEQEHARLIEITSIFGLPGETRKGTTQPAIIAEQAVEARLASHAPPRAITALLASKQLPLEEKIEHLYRAAVGRTPTSDERENVLKLVGATGAREDGWRIVWWTLVNSRP